MLNPMKALLTGLLFAGLTFALAGCSGEEKYDKPDEAKAGASSQFETASDSASKTGGPAKASQNKVDQPASDN